MRESGSTLTIVDYSDYRDFLKARFRELKSAHPYFSYQYCSVRLDVTRSYLTRVLLKKRHTSVDKIFPIAKLFKLTQTETEYLLFLYLLNTTREPSTGEFFNQILARLRYHLRNTPQLSRKDRPRSELDFLQDAASMAIYGLVASKGFRDDIDWMHRRLRKDCFTKDQLRAAWEGLLRSGVVQKEGDRYFWKHPERINFAQLSPFEMSQEKIFASGLESALASLARPDISPFQRQMLVLTIDSESALKIVQAYARLQEEILQITSESSKGEEIFFVSNNFFKVSEN